MMATPSAVAQVGVPLKMDRLSLAVGPATGMAYVQYVIVPVNRGARVGARFFLQRVDGRGRASQETVTPETDSGPIVLTLRQDVANKGVLRLPLEPGRYGACRVVLYHSPDGRTVDFNKTVYDSATDPSLAGLRLNMTIRGPKRLLVPEIVTTEKPEITREAAGWKVALDAEVRVPEEYYAPGGGLWAVAKGASGLSRQWVSLSSLGGEGGAKTGSVRFQFEGVQPSLWAVRVGLARSGAPGEVRWAEGRTDFEVGDRAWRVSAPRSMVPPRVRVRNRRFETLDGKRHEFYADAPSALSTVKFIRGGNYGNAIAVTIAPENNRPEYFRSLKAIGLRFIRFNLHPDRYLKDELYREVVDQTIQNIWMAGLYPIVGPRDFAEAESGIESTVQRQLAQRTSRTLQLLQMLARRYKGQPVWFHIMNEPYLYQTWEQWRPVAVRYVKAIRAIDPDAFVIVPFEAWAGDGRGAAADPITEARVDLYDGHAYLNPSQVAERFEPALKAGLPVLLGDYGGSSALYLRQMNTAIRQLPPGLMAVAPWAFTVPEEDSLPLVESFAAGQVKYTAVGQVVADVFEAWLKGRGAGPR
jgi:hypothetical protein